MVIIDTHSHLFLEEFVSDLPQVIERARNIGVAKIFMPNIDSSTISPMLNLVSKYAGYCFPMIGLHPTSVDNRYETQLSYMKELLEKPHEYVGIGEVGIDLYWDKSFRKEQMHAFDIQIQWALEYKLPLIIHSRDSLKEILQVMKPYRETSLRGIFHSFTGTLDEAEQLLGFNNFKLGINGVVTFNKSTLPEVLRNVSLDKIVLETDSPYLTPVPNRGKRNESRNIIDTLNKVAEIYQVMPSQVAEITTKNALSIFNMQEE